MDKNGLIKIALVAGGVYLIYRYLENSGLWAQWFGGGNTFDTTDPQFIQKVTQYCHANAGGTVNLTQGGKAYGSGTCQQILAALQGAPPPAGTAAPNPPPTGTATAPPPPATTTTTTTTAPPPAANSQVATQLQALMQQQVQRTTGTVSEWNWVWRNMYKNDPNAPIITTSSYAVDQQIGVNDYLNLRSAQGLSGLASTAAVSQMFDAPSGYRWRM